MVEVVNSATGRILPDSLETEAFPATVWFDALYPCGKQGVGPIKPDHPDNQRFREILDFALLDSDMGNRENLQSACGLDFHPLLWLSMA